MRDFNKDCSTVRKLFCKTKSPLSRRCLGTYFAKNVFDREGDYISMGEFNDLMDKMDIPSRGKKNKNYYAIRLRYENQVEHNIRGNKFLEEEL